MARTNQNETRVKDFGTLSPLHEEKEVSGTSLGIDPSATHTFPLLWLWDRCSSEKSDGTAACSSLNSLSGFRRAKASNKLLLSDLMSLLSRKGPTRSKSSRILTAVNPNVRISRGLPLGSMETEMLNYNINNLYGDTDPLYKGGCLCKWDTIPDEIIGHWNWAALTENPCWYRTEILPAFEKHSSLTRDIRVEAPLKRSNAHALPKSLPKVFTKVLPKALSALSHKGKNRSLGGAQSNSNVLPTDQAQIPHGATRYGYVAGENYSFSDGDDYINVDGNVPSNENQRAVSEDNISENDSNDGDQNGTEFDDVNEYENPDPVYDDANGDGDPDTISGTGDEHVTDDGLGYADNDTISDTYQADSYTPDCQEGRDGGGYDGGCDDGGYDDGN